MKAGTGAIPLTLLILSMSVASRALGAQATGKSTGIQVCSLLTDAEIKQLVARGGSASEKNETPLAGGSSCTYGIGRGQIMVFSGPKAEANFTDLLKGFHKDTVTKHPVSGVGEGAYVIYPKPRDEYEVRVGLLATKYRQYMLGISLEPDKGKPSESVQPDLIALTKVVMQKLP
jgi:hypothetical protein